jgi:hypothetical protein
LVCLLRIWTNIQQLESGWEKMGMWHGLPRLEGVKI